MTTEPNPFTDTLAQIRASIDEPFESIRMTLDLHPADTLGDPADEGSAAWHLRHAAEVFRTHAHHLIGPETNDWPPLPTDATKHLDAIETLRADAARVTEWASEHLDPSATVHYGRDLTVSDMLGVMLRHIVWHAAAAHYWCRWKRPSEPSD
ncbi:MAG: hypothetical protein AB8F26_00480 [Phycisphaerales bacterium]